MYCLAHGLYNPSHVKHSIVRRKLPISRAFHLIDTWELTSIFWVTTTTTIIILGLNEVPKYIIFLNPEPVSDHHQARLKTITDGRMNHRYAVYPALFCDQYTMIDSYNQKISGNEIQIISNINYSTHTGKLSMHAPYPTDHHSTSARSTRCHLESA